LNYFELFSLPAQFSIDQTQLSATYRELQKQYHPDKSVMLSEREKLAAMQKSTEINDAYQTLKNSCLRAQYLLRLAGHDLALEKQTFQDSGFLIQQMEWREKITSFTVDDEQEIEDFTVDIQKQVLDLESLIESQLALDDFQGAADSIRKLKFMLKLQTELELLEEKLFD
jgi:molecular chaperone HscB